jgi:outer membrane protein TolC
VNKTSLSLLACLVLGLTSPTAFSQDKPREKVTLTLEKSISLALSQNPLYLASQERVDGAQARVRQAASQFFPSLNAVGQDNLDRKVFTLDFPSFIPGGRPQRVAIDFTKNYQFTLALNVPLYTGGRLTSGYRQARYGFLAAGESARQTNQETVFNVKKAFSDYLVAREYVKVTEEALSLAEKTLQNVKNMYEVGMASRLDLLRAEVRVANLKPPVIQARNNVNITELGLKTLLGLDASQPVEVVGDLVFEPKEVSLEESLAKALDNRPELSQIDYQKKIAHEMQKIAIASSLPTVAISGNYNYWSNFIKFTRGNWESFYSFNLVLSIPIFNGFQAPAQVAEAKAMIREIEQTQKGLTDAIKFEVEAAHLNLNQAKESFLSQEKNIEQAQEGVRVAELNYSEGLATILDVSAAQVALTEARTNRLRAIYEYVIAQAQLEKAMGLSWKRTE